MPTNLSPGVEFNERDITQVIPSVTSAVGAIVMHSAKGPVNKRLLLTNPSDLEKILGRPNNTNFTHWFTAEAFLKQSNQLYAVRVEDSTKKVAGLTVGISASGLGNIVLSEPTTKVTELFPLSYDDIKSHEAKKDYSLPPGTGAGELDNPANNLYTEDSYHFYGVGPGTYYNDISVVVVNSADFILLQDLKAELVSAVDQAEVNLICDKYYNGTPATTATSAVDYLSNSLIKYEVMTPPVAPSTDWFVDRSMLNIVTAFENGPTTPDEAVLIVFDEFDNVVESYVFSNDPEKRDTLGNMMFGPQLVNGNSGLIYFFIGGDPEGAAGITMVSTRKTYLGGADELTGDIPGTGLNDLTGEILTQWQEQFSSTEDIEVDLLLDPDYNDSIKRYLDQLSSTIRKDCFAILNVPMSYMLNVTNFRPIAQPYLTMKNYVANILNINSSYSAIYGNYFKIFDRFAEKERWVPASGFCAAVMAFTDFNDAQWFAPAGLNRGIISNVIDVAVNPNKAQRDVLYYNRINPIVKFQGEGIVIFGQKTLQAKASAFDRINVRRLFLHMEKSITKMARYSLFEQNDDFTRTRFRGIVTPFLADIKARRGVTDYLVVCDETNNTPDTIDHNEMHAEILVKPTRVVEFIKLTFTAVATGVEFSEVVVRG
jgi:phage tail sheath protein FI